MSQKTIDNRNNWIFASYKNVLTDKEYLLRQIINQMIIKSLKMFEYDDLPDTIPQKDLELQLQCGGYSIWTEVDGKLYTFLGGLGGKPNPYYLPTIATVSNPALSFTENLVIDDNCIVMLNDFLYQGLMPLHNKYGSLLTEAEISLRYAIINARVPALVQADNDSSYESAKRFFDKIEKGEEYGVISTSEFFDGIRSQDFYKENYIKDIIESIQYIKGSWYNELGLNAAFNMKREAINEAEATLNEDILVPSIDDMLDCRQKALDKINKKYGTNIKVRLSSVWAKNKKIDELSIEREEVEIDSIDTDDNFNEVEEKEVEIDET